MTVDRVLAAHDRRARRARARRRGDEVRGRRRFSWTRTSGASTLPAASLRNVSGPGRPMNT